MGARPVDAHVPFADRVAARYLSNARLSAVVGGSLGVRTLFVWQPCPFYRRDPARHPFPFTAPDQGVQAVYERLSRPNAELPINFLWLADGQDQLAEPLYVDGIHYSPAFNTLLAGRIADWLKTNGWLD